MKKLFTLIVLACISVGMAKAQDKTAVTATQTTRVESKEKLKKVEAQPRTTESAKIDQRATNVKRIDGNNTRGVVLTEEQMKARVKENAAKAGQNAKKGEIKE